MKLGRAWIVAILAAGLLLGACGGDGTEEEEAAPAAAEPAQLNFTARDFKFDTGGTTSVPAGLVEITLTNAGKEPHQVQLFKLKPGADFKTFSKTLIQDRTGIAYLQSASSVGGLGGLQPGESQSVTNRLEPGDYALVCFVEGHHARGMMSPFQVTEATGTEAQEPAAAAKISGSDFKYIVPEGFSGRGTVEFVNNGPSEHEAQIFKLNATLEQIEKFFARPQGPPPGGEPQVVGGSGAIQPGTSAFVDLDLEPGTYAFVCFVTDAKQKKSHFDLGMVEAFAVK